MNIREIWRLFTFVSRQRIPLLAVYWIQLTAMDADWNGRGNDVGLRVTIIEKARTYISRDT